MIKSFRSFGDEGLAALLDPLGKRTLSTKERTPTRTVRIYLYEQKENH